MMQSIKSRNVFLLVVTLLVTALVMPRVSPAQAEDQLEQISAALHEQLREEERGEQKPKLDRRLLKAFYAPRDFRPVWVDATGPLFRAGQLWLTLQAAEQEGLEGESYHQELISRAWDSRSVPALAHLELLLTDAFLHYSVDVGTGRADPEMVDPLWNIAAPEADPVATLNTVLAAENFDTALSDLVPPHLGYRRLRNALAEYQRLALQGGWPSLPPGPYLKYGQRHPQVTVLRRRLMVEGDLQLGPVSDETLFDTPLQFAVERFQVRHGLKVDGIVGPATRETMNVPVAERIGQIRLNMERWRWLSKALGRRYLMVNMAGYELAAIEDNRLLFTMPVIVGTRERPTPVVGGKIHTVVFHPYWTVPPTIIFEDLVPQQRRDPGYLKSRGIRVFTYQTDAGELDPAQINWARVDKEHFPYILRQDPGPTNPLGRIKFMFSNKFQVYLHDTPTRHYFNEPSRHFSSGCIRVAEPVQLANYVLSREEGWTPERIERAIGSGENRDVKVSRSVPIYLLYWTAWVGEGGAVYFVKDVYERDALTSLCSPRDITP
jgi:murein L,D-transpeptidase YcbB/YkuD